MLIGRRHGRDHKLRVWRFRAQDEGFLDKTLPVDVKEGETGPAQNQPWMVHSLPVNALNFCAFDMVFLQSRPGNEEKNEEQPDSSSDSQPSSDSASQTPVLVAVPNALNSGAIDIFHLPLERRVSTIPADTATNTGMVMAVRLLLSSSGELYAASAYEDGHVMVYVRCGRLTSQEISSSANGKGAAWTWEKLYTSRPHTQPVLSIDVAPSEEYFFSSSADAVLVKHPIPNAGLAGVGHPEEKPLKTLNTKHFGQQGLRVRSDGKIFATAGWDSRIRVYSCKTTKELAVLKWHKDGCYAVAFAEVFGDDSTASSTNDTDDRKDEGDKKDTQLTNCNDRGFSLATVQHQRNQKAQRTHWLAAGSKDGKISLWDIY